MWTIEEDLAAQVAKHEATLRRVGKEGQLAPVDTAERHSKVRIADERLREAEDLGMADPNAYKIAQLIAVQDPVARESILLAAPAPLRMSLIRSAPVWPQFRRPPWVPRQTHRPSPATCCFRRQLTKHEAPPIRRHFPSLKRLQKELLGASPKYMCDFLLYMAAWEKMISARPSTIDGRLAACDGATAGMCRRTFPQQ